MPLTNAERQARYRRSLKSKASLDSLGDRARKAVDRAITALWSWKVRNPDDGSFDGLDTVEQFRAAFAASDRGDGGLVPSCREFLRYPDDLTEDEARALATVVELDDALTLAAERPAKSGKRRPR